MLHKALSANFYYYFYFTSFAGKVCLGFAENEAASTKG